MPPPALVVYWKILPYREAEEDVLEKLKDMLRDFLDPNMNYDYFKPEFSEENTIECSIPNAVLAFYRFCKRKQII